MVLRLIIAITVTGALAFGFQNCQSRVGSTSAAGSTNNLSIAPTVQSESTKGCLFTLSSGASGGTADSTLPDCARECLINSGLNPAETLVCSYNGAVINFVQTATGPGCYFFLLNGGAGSTATSDQPSCAAECAQNASLNPNDTLLCFYNQMALNYTQNATTNFAHPGCYFTLAQGGSGATAQSTRAECQAECQQNARLNPGNTLSCFFNDQPL